MPKLFERTIDWIKGNAAAQSAEPADADCGSLQLTAPVDLIAAGETAEGGSPKRPTFKIAAYSGVPMNVAGYYYPVIIDLSGLKASGQQMPVLLDHELSRIVGQTNKVKIDAKASSVNVEGIVTGDDADAAKVVSHAKNGFKWQASVGAQVTRREFLEAGNTATVNGKLVAGPMVIAREARLHEVSFTAIGADSQTSAAVAAHQQPSTEAQSMTFEQWLKANGWDRSTLTEQQATTLRAAFTAEVEAAKTDPPSQPAAPGQSESGSPNQAATPPPVSATGVTDTGVSGATENGLTLNDVRAEHARIANINRICGNNHSDIAAKAIEEGWTADQAELHVLRASRGAQAPMTIISSGKSAGSGQQERPDLIEAAICIQANLGDDRLVKAFGEQTLDAARKQFRHGVSLQQMLLEAAWNGGYAERHFPRGTGLKELLRAAFSTYSLPGHFSNTANKFMLAGFEKVESTWREISAIRDVNDFKQVTSYRLTGALEFEAINAAGKLEHGTLGEEDFTNRARTYGIVLSVTREDIKNDDLGALTAIPRRIGRGGALKLNTVFWTAFMDNADFFKADNNNYLDGAGSALGVDALTALETLFLNQVDADGKPLGITPEILLVPNALNVTATQLAQDLELRDTTASKVRTTGNPHAGKFRPVRSSYLSNAAIEGNSTKAHYLLADPMDVPTMEVAFVDGVQQPFVETADADFEELGVQMRGYLDFGASKQDSRGGAKGKGEA